MSSKKKYVLVMPDTGKSPIETDAVKKVIHVPPPKILDKEVTSDINTVHPLKAEIAEFEAVGRNNKYPTSPVVKSGVNFLRLLYILCVPFLIYMVFTFKSLIDVISFSIVFGILYYYQFAYLNKIHKVKDSSSLKFIKSTFDFELIVMLILVAVFLFIFIIN